MSWERTLIDSIENGIFIVNNRFEILFWNTWLATHTGILPRDAQGSTLEDLFPETSFKLFKRKVKIAQKLRSSTFMNSSVEKYVIPIDLNRITKSIFRHMRQDVVITPLSDTDIGVVIYDASALLEAKTIIAEQLTLVEKQATTDTLTGCFNRKMFNDLLAAEIKKAERHERTFCLALFDIDDFKSVNDTYGHPVGDQVLKQVVAVIRGVIRKSDVVARWGGEEFILLIPETGIEGASVLAEKVRKAIASYEFSGPGHKTCSFGVAGYISGWPAERLVTQADKALYFAKKNGKNQVCIASEESLFTFRDGQLNPV